mmetsp:Transcript_34845/g.87790  ORF Transcript_34845/g.87790 Transcript_34845/m.87790 type:complete len:224 (-) Transcript_34845:178-849(-)
MLSMGGPPPRCVDAVVVAGAVSTLSTAVPVAFTPPGSERARRLTSSSRRSEPTTPIPASAAARPCSRRSPSVACMADILAAARLRPISTRQLAPEPPHTPQSSTPPSASQQIIAASSSPGQQLPSASTTTAEPSHTPQASRRPLAQQRPLASTSAQAGQHVPSADTLPLSQQLPVGSMTPSPHTTTSLAICVPQVGPLNPSSQTQVPGEQSLAAVHSVSEGMK